MCNRYSMTQRTSNSVNSHLDLTVDRSRFSPSLSAIFLLRAFPLVAETTYDVHDAAAAWRAKKRKRTRRNGSTVICGGRKVDSRVRTAQLSADENEL